MNADIDFGELRSQQPTQGLRPDEDHYFAVEWIGERQSGDLPIYVDLDVMREMERHAESDTRVELGGVLLGRQAVDREGQAFVVVEDSIRAQHYQATRGSFKFTHDTWQQITRDRERAPPHRQMVGWYHTHPNWGIFLSGMDDFICENFFNSPLDLALVIDPCRRERGWFQWRAGATVPVAAFAAIAHRERTQELVEYRQACWENSGDLGMDRTRTSTTSNGGVTVQVVERRGTHEWLGFALLFSQIAVLIGAIWLSGSWDGRGVGRSPAVASETRQDALQAAREGALLQALKAIAQDPQAWEQTVDRLAVLEQEHTLQREAVQSHIARLELLQRELQEARRQQESLVRDNARLNGQLTEAKRLASTESSSALIGNDPWSLFTGYGWLVVLAGVIVGGFCGGVIGWRWRSEEQTRRDGAAELTAEFAGARERD